MRDYLKRFLIAGIVALCVSLLFLGGKHSQAETIEQNANWIWPAEGIITDIFGTRSGTHKGIDIGGGLGSPIYAVDDATVSKSYYSESYGHVVFLKHDKGDYETVYAHLNKRNVNDGQKIHQGEVIGEMGNTGHSSGVHLHFEIHQTNWTYNKENAINPAVILGGVEVGQEIQVTKQASVEKATTQSDSEQMNRQQEVTVAEKKEAKLTEEEVNTDKNASIVTTRLNEFYEDRSSTEEKRKQEIVEIEYEVVLGDTLWGIAKQHDVTVRSIMERNKLQSDLLIPGQKLTVVLLKDHVYTINTSIEEITK